MGSPPTRRTSKQSGALLSVESFDGPIWEPACGEGHIAKVLIQAGHEVVSTDLVDYGFGEAKRDFLAERKPLAKHIITNPPYGRGLADTFIKHALKLTAETGGNVAMLMNVLSLCHPTRHDFYAGTPPAAVYALDECICWPNGDPAQATTTIAKQRYCWMVWKNGHTPHAIGVAEHRSPQRRWHPSATRLLGGLKNDNISY